MQRVVETLVELYEATDRPEKAAEWKKWAPREAPAAAPTRRAAPATPTAPVTPPPATAPKP